MSTPILTTKLYISPTRTELAALNEGPYRKLETLPDPFLFIRVSETLRVLL